MSFFSRETVAEETLDNVVSCHHYLIALHHAESRPERTSMVYVALLQLQKTNHLSLPLTNDHTKTKQ